MSGYPPGCTQDHVDAAAGYGPHDDPAPVEEDGDEVFGVPERCVKWPCSGVVEPRGGQHRCRDCGAFYGPVEVDEDDPDALRDVLNGLLPSPAPRGEQR